MTRASSILSARTIQFFENGLWDVHGLDPYAHKAYHGTRGGPHQRHFVELCSPLGRARSPMSLVFSATPSRVGHIGKTSDTTRAPLKSR